jgi:cytochrome b
MKTYIWSVPTRIYHWLTFIGITGALIFTINDEYLNFHTASGYLVFVLSLFRLIWAFWGPKYSVIRDFRMNLKSIKVFFQNFSSQHSQYLGHNPLASVVMTGIIILVPLTCLSGLFTLASEGLAPFNFLILSKSELYKEIHEIFVTFLIIIIAFHLIGIVTEIFFSGSLGTLKSMFTGFKNIEGESVKLNVSQKVISMIFILIAVFLFITGATQQHFPKEEKTTGQEKKELKLNQYDD